MKQRIIDLQYKIDKYYNQLKKKNILVKPMLVSINNLLNSNPTNDQIYQYLNKHDNIIFTMEYYINGIEQKTIFQNKVKLLINKIEKYKENLNSDDILIETTLSVLKYLLAEEIADDERIRLFNISSNTIKIIEKGKR